MDSYNQNSNASPENSSLRTNVSHSSPEIMEEADVYVPKFSVTQEALEFYGIYLKERNTDSQKLEGTLDDPEIKNKIYTTLVQELQIGNTHLLEYILSEKLLSKNELQKYDIHSLKETANKILENMHGQQRARDIDSFLESGIFTEEEALNARYATY